MRSGTIASLQPLKERVLACLEGGARAAGCRMEYRATCPEYSDLRTNAPMAELYRENMTRLGRQVQEDSDARSVVGSTDMGNVSHLVPSIHPIIKVSPSDVAIHTAEFAGWAAAPEGDKAVVDGAKALAMTIADLWARPEALAQAQAEFERDMRVRAGNGREP